MKKRYIFILFVMAFYFINSNEVKTDLSSPKVSLSNLKLKKQNSILNKQAVPSLAPATDLQQSSETVTEQTPSAAIMENLNLNLIEVITVHNSEQVYQTAFEGRLTTNEGFIDSLSVSIGQDFSLDITNQQLTGNTFNYELNFETLSGMFYQTDQDSYIVYLSNGPYSGTRLMFKNQATTEDYAYNNL